MITRGESKPERPRTPFR